jgi:chromosome segregation ATPase
MRRNQWLAVLAAIFVFSAPGWCRQSGQNQGQNQVQDQTAQAAPPQPDSLADAARRARAQKKEEPKATKVFTNENIPSTASISTSAPTPGDASATPSDADSGKAPKGSDEKMWRDKFAKLNHQLDQDQAELDVLQRELGVLSNQYYGGDPVKAMQQGMSQSEITEKNAKIDAKKKDVEADKQAIADAEVDLRKAGGDPGWER